jgi:hypothetical protein
MCTIVLIRQNRLGKMDNALAIKRVLLTLLLLWLAAFLISKMTAYYVSSTTPGFLEDMEKAAMHSSIIRAKIGEQKGFESTYNENDLNTDTIRFKVKIQGADKELLLSGYALKNGGDWVPVTIDSTYRDN